MIDTFELILALVGSGVIGSAITTIIFTQLELRRIQKEIDKL